MRQGARAHRVSPYLLLPRAHGAVATAEGSGALGASSLSAHRLTTTTTTGMGTWFGLVELQNLKGLRQEFSGTLPSFLGPMAATWACQACTFHNSFLLPFCEICGTQRKDAHSVSRFSTVHVAFIGGVVVVVVVDAVSVILYGLGAVWLAGRRMGGLRHLWRKGRESRLPHVLQGLCCWFRVHLSRGPHLPVPAVLWTRVADRGIQPSTFLPACLSF